MNRRDDKIIEIAGREIGGGRPCFIIAEMSANHNQDFDEAVRIIQAAKESGADAVKLQTYTPDTLTIDCNNDYFNIEGTLWDGENLYSLYKKAYTPWDWYPGLKEAAEKAGISLFSTPFDRTAVDFLEGMDVPAYKVASFELVDIPLIKYIAGKGKPVILSTGMAALAEITEAVEAARESGAKEIALLKCTSNYPALPEDMNLATIPHLAEVFQVVSGLSDHTLGIAVPVASVALGASIVEKHFTLSRKKEGPDSAFSLEPDEFKCMVDAIRIAEKSVGEVSFSVTGQEEKSRQLRRSLFVVKDIKAGELLTADNVRSIRPGHGLAPKHYHTVLGKRAIKELKRGSPLRWDLIDR